MGGVKQANPTSTVVSQYINVGQPNIGQPHVG